MTLELPALVRVRSIARLDYHQQGLLPDILAVSIPAIAASLGRRQCWNAGGTVARRHQLHPGFPTALDEIRGKTMRYVVM